MLVIGRLSAAELPLHFMVVPPLTIDSPQRKGLVGDLVLEAMKRAGYRVKLIVDPSPRAMATVQQRQNAFIIPLARLKDREDKYTWVAPITRVDRAFFTRGRRVASFAEAKASFATVAVSRGTAGVSILLEQGFSREQIVEVNQGTAAPRMLRAGRIDAWYNLVLESQVLLEEVGAPGVVMGAKLGSTEQYLACSKTCDPAVVAKLGQTLRAMRADGSAARIMSRYAAD